MTTPDPGRWRYSWLVRPLVAVTGSGLADDAGRWHARCDKNSTHWPDNAPCRPVAARSDLAVTRQIPGCCTRPAQLAVLPGSTRGLALAVWLPAVDPHRAPAQPTSAGACADLSPTPLPPDVCEPQRRAPRSTMQQIAAVLATGSIVLVVVAPVSIELFLQYQQGCRLGQGFVFTTQLLLQVPDPFLIRLGLRFIVSAPKSAPIFSEITSSHWRSMTSTLGFRYDHSRTR